MSAPTPSITSLTARAVVAPLARPMRTASGTIPAAPLVLIDIATDSGVVGRSYLFGYTPLVLGPLRDLLERLGELLVGHPVAPADVAKAMAARFRLLGRQGLLGMALSGIDMALWDASAKSMDMPLCRLLGAEPRPLPAYDSLGIVTGAEDLKAIDRSVASGFHAVKIKIGDGGLAADVETVRAVREVIGPETSLMIDYNQSLDAAEAIRRSRRLAEFDLTWMEEPVAAEDLRGHARVREAGAVPVQTGENWWWPNAMVEAIDAGACDFAMPDLMKIGGITGWMAAVGHAAARGIPVSSHIFVEASAHVLAATPTAHFVEYLDFAGAVLRDPPRPENGTVIPRGPGLGIEWNEAAVSRHLV